MFKILEILITDCVQKCIFSECITIIPSLTDEIPAELEHIYFNPGDLSNSFFRVYSDKLQLYVTDDKDVETLMYELLIKDAHTDRLKIVDFCEKYYDISLLFEGLNSKTPQSDTDL